jgi:hypothetical protein
MLLTHSIYLLGPLAFTVGWRHTGEKSRQTFLNRNAPVAIAVTSGTTNLYPNRPDQTRPDHSANLLHYIMETFCACKKPEDYQMLRIFNIWNFIPLANTTAADVIISHTLSFCPSVRLSFFFFLSPSNSLFLSFVASFFVYFLLYFLFFSLCSVSLYPCFSLDVLKCRDYACCSKCGNIK